MIQVWNVKLKPAQNKLYGELSKNWNQDNSLMLMILYLQKKDKKMPKM